MGNRISRGTESVCAGPFACFYGANARVCSADFDLKEPACGIQIFFLSNRSVRVDNAKLEKVLIELALSR